MYSYKPRLAWPVHTVPTVQGIQRILRIKNFSANQAIGEVFSCLFIYFYIFNKKRYVQQVQCVQPTDTKGYSCTPLVHTSSQVCTAGNNQFGALVFKCFLFSKRVARHSRDSAIRSEDLIVDFFTPVVFSRATAIRLISPPNSFN